MKLMNGAGLALLLLCGSVGSVAADEEQDYVDFSSQVTPLCEVDNLRVAPPKTWINVPIETNSEYLSGCQMMRIVNEELRGILRVLSLDLQKAPPSDVPWQEQIIAVEASLIQLMGIQVIEPIWREDEVPIAGAGFGNGKALGLSTKIEGSDVPQEAHMLVFDGPTHKYLVDLLTPAKSVGDGSDYDYNSNSMAAVMSGFYTPKK